MPNLGQVIHSQISCRLCPLHANGPAPLYVPLHVQGQPPLIIFDRPFSDVVTPCRDPRLERLISLDARLVSAAVTYATSCWSDWSSPAPEHSVSACKRHRAAERGALNPNLIVAVGSMAADTINLADAFVENSVLIHDTGARVLCLPEEIESSDAKLIRSCVDTITVSYDIS